MRHSDSDSPGIKTFLDRNLAKQLIFFFLSHGWPLLENVHALGALQDFRVAPDIKAPFCITQPIVSTQYNSYSQGRESRVLKQKP